MVYFLIVLGVFCVKEIIFENWFMYVFELMWMGVEIVIDG